EDVVRQAKENLGMYGKKTILFIDEIHRFNKGQQDYLLPFVEDGTLVLIGATTENPYFEVNSALISRSIVFELKPLTKEETKTLILRALKDPVKGLGSFHVDIDDDALDFIADIAGGDARVALNAVELAALTTDPELRPAGASGCAGTTGPDRDGTAGRIRITLEIAENCVQKRAIRYEKSGDNHYDTISAFIKSMRGSDPDAAVYYLARMLYAGEDIKFIARRIMICASEDVGNADPQALQVAVAASQAVERIGMPEARIILAHAAIYVACAPKSNAVVVPIDQADRHVREHDVKTVPPHLQDAHYHGHEALGRGIGYKYAHDFPGNYVEQQYLPDEVVGTVFYKPGENGYEKEIGERLRRLKEPHTEED
ncbi:MAG: replication-associated recombination protein A, partial [Lachnospiraceae bacterium]|nr:replication-associated recombination protein A [Lachnospiraceae bacterium]